MRELTTYEKRLLASCSNDLEKVASVLEMEMINIAGNSEAQALVANEALGSDSMDYVHVFRAAAKLLRLNQTPDKVALKQVVKDIEGIRVVEILTAMGGVNIYDWNGSDFGAYYYIGGDSNIRVDRNAPIGYKVIEI